MYVIYSFGSKYKISPCQPHERKNLAQHTRCHWVLRSAFVYQFWSRSWFCAVCSCVSLTFDHLISYRRHRCLWRHAVRQKDRWAGWLRPPVMMPPWRITKYMTLCSVSLAYWSPYCYSTIDQINCTTAPTGVCSCARVSPHPFWVIVYTSMSYIIKNAR